MICAEVCLLGIFSGWAYHFLPESESSWLLFIPSGYRSPYLYVEGQCDNQNDCGGCDIGLELMGSLSFHEFSCESKEKSTCTLSRFSYVCIGWFSHHCHWLNFFPFKGSKTVTETYMEWHSNVMWMWLLYFFWTWHNVLECSVAKYDMLSVSNPFFVLHLTFFISFGRVMI